MRINKYIAKSGFTSRRKADELIKEGRVFVNDKKVSELGLDIKKEDIVRVDKEVLEFEDLFYYKLNKPVGYISSNYDPHNPKDLNDLVKINKRFFTAGRLDMDSHGLMLITNDGDLVNNLIHPRFKIDKEYIVRVDRLLSKKEEEVFEKSIDLGDNQITKDSKISLLDRKNKIYKVIIHQGYKRQIRRMFSYFSSNVLDLKRLAIGQIKLLDLKEGELTKISDQEYEYLKSIH